MSRHRILSMRVPSKAVNHAASQSFDRLCETTAIFAVSEDSQQSRSAHMSPPEDTSIVLLGGRGRAVARDDVAPFQPAMEIDVGAALRAKRLEYRLHGLAADRADLAISGLGRALRHGANMGGACRRAKLLSYHSL